jgi:hypothetical protein
MSETFYHDVLEWSPDDASFEFVPGMRAKVFDKNGIECSEAFCRINLVTGECLKHAVDADGELLVDVFSDPPVTKKEVVNLAPPLRVVDSDGNVFLPEAAKTDRPS